MTKEKVYDHITEFLEIEGCPVEGDLDFGELNINHSAFAAISPIFNALYTRPDVSLQIRREKEIVFTNGETRGTVVLDLI